jgi:hypothetical protein
MEEKSSWEQANRGGKLGLVWRNRKKISQIINDYLCLPFFLLIILCIGALEKGKATGEKRTFFKITRRRKGGMQV